MSLWAAGARSVAAGPATGTTSASRSASYAARSTVADDGIDVRGHLHWALLDTFEWMAGHARTLGLIAVDRETLERTTKPSARWLGEVARANALV